MQFRARTSPTSVGPVPHPIKQVAHIARFVNCNAIFYMIRAAPLPWRFTCHLV